MSGAAEPSLFDAEQGLYVVPIRHYSPACAMHLRALIAEVAPATILIEGPSDFDPLIPLLTDAATKPPIAIVSMVEPADKSRRRAVSYFPFCRHSPEFVALTEAAKRGITTRFIDLPASDKVFTVLEDEAARPALTDEHHFDSSDYVRALTQRLGCRDGNEAWDHLFETRIAAPGWRDFFDEVGRYCGHIRACTPHSVMEADGALARETRMIAHVREALRAGRGPIVVVVGGFHAPAIVSLDGATAEVPRTSPTSASSAYLIRYGYRQLNSLTGYSAGLPMPGFYDALWRMAEAMPGESPFAALAIDLLTAFSAHLRTTLPALAPPIPVLMATIEGAHRLAALRGRPGPGRDDLLDACRSTLLKGEETGDATPILAELAAWLTGAVIGNVPPSAGSPPLVEAVRARARELGFTIEDGERRNRELDLYRKDRHREASRFLHGLVFLGAGFARRTGGPDFRAGVNLDRLFETWSVMWSPMVEARLIERSVDADSLEEAVAVEVLRRLAALDTAGQGGNAVAAIDLFAAACQAGVAGRAGVVLPYIEQAVTRDGDLATVAAALRDLVGLWRGRTMLGLDGATPIEALIATAWRRALFLLPDLVHAGVDRIGVTLEAMVMLREVVEIARVDLPGIDPTLFEEAITGLLGAALHPSLAGAVAALAYLTGRIDEDSLAHRLSGELGGAYADPAGRVAWLSGVIAISRELLWQIPSLIDAADGLLAATDEDGFVELLPHLRLAFARLDPREIDRLAQVVAAHHGVGAASLTVTHDITQQEEADNLAVERAILATLRADGLA